MKIIYVTASLPYGPVESFIIPEIKELKKQGHDVLVIPRSPKGNIQHSDVQQFVNEQFILPFISIQILWSAIIVSIKHPILVLSNLFRLLKSRNFIVLIKNISIYPKSLWLTYVAQKWGAEHIHAHWASTTSTMALSAAEISGISWSFTAHRWDITENNILREKVKSACFVRVIDNAGADELKALIRLPEWQPKVIHMGVNTRFYKNYIPPKKRSTLRFVTAANFVEKKGHIYLLKSLKQLKEQGIHVDLDLVGDGPLKNKLLTQCEELGIKEQVNFLGLLSHKNLIEKLETQNWDIMVLPSIVTNNGEKEGIPVSLMEAMSCGIPVISTSTGGIPELLNNEAGIMVSPEDPISLSLAIKSIITDQELREELSNTGKNRIEEEFEISAVINKLIDEIKKCVEKRE